MDYVSKCNICHLKLQGLCRGQTILQGEFVFLIRSYILITFDRENVITLRFTVLALSFFNIR